MSPDEEAEALRLMDAIDARIDACHQHVNDMLGSIGRIEASLTRIEDHLKAIDADMRARLDAWRNR
jgi:hypothetical protein